MSGYDAPLSRDEWAEVYTLATANLVSAPKNISEDELRQDVLDYTVEDCDGGSLWHLPRHRIATVVDQVIRDNDCQG